MHPDTIIDLGFYRGGSEHLCEGNVGYPPGMLVVEGKHRDASMYHDIAHIAYVRNTTESGACSSMQYLWSSMQYLWDYKLNRDAIVGHILIY